jgi:hypothetical protein
MHSLFVSVGLLVVKCAHLAQDFCLRKSVVDVAIDSHARESFVCIYKRE